MTIVDPWCISYTPFNIIFVIWPFKAPQWASATYIYTRRAVVRTPCATQITWSRNRSSHFGQGGVWHSRPCNLCPPQRGFVVPQPLGWRSTRGKYLFSHSVKDVGDSGVSLLKYRRVLGFIWVGMRNILDENRPPQARKFMILFAAWSIIVCVCVSNRSHCTCPAWN